MAGVLLEKCFLYVQSSTFWGFHRSVHIYKTVQAFFVSLARLRNVRVFIYLDDILIMNDSSRGLKANLYRVAFDLYQAGFNLGTDKCVLEPVQVLEYLGFELCMTDVSVSIPVKKKDKVKLLLAETLSRYPLLSPRGALKVAGSLVSLRPVFENLCLLRTRSLYKLSCGSEDWDEEKIAGCDLRSDLVFWIRLLSNSPFKSYLSVVCQQPQDLIYVDASALAWAGVLHMSSGRKELAQGALSQLLISQSSALREIFALYSTVFSFKHLTKDSNVRCFTDNGSTTSSVLH